MSGATLSWLPWMYALGWALLHFLWQGALIAASYAALRFATRGSDARIRYGLGLLAMLAMALCVPLTMVEVWPDAQRSAAVTTLTLPTAIPAVAQSVPSLPVQGFDSATALEPWLPWLVGFWIAGVALLSLRAYGHWWRLKRLVQRHALAVPEWEGRLLRLRERLGVSRPVRILHSALVATPSLIGWLRPIILLPTEMLVGLTPGQIDLVLAHELGHIRRWDFLCNLLQIGVETLLFYHPAVHWISREVRNDRENCCDDLVLGLGASPVEYAEVLTYLEEFREPSSAPMVAATGGALLGRIQRIIGAESTATGGVWTGTHSFFLLALVLLAALSTQRLPWSAQLVAPTGYAEPMRSTLVARNAPPPHAPPSLAELRAATPASARVASAAITAPLPAIGVTDERAPSVPPPVLPHQPETLQPARPELAWAVADIGLRVERGAGLLPEVAAPSDAVAPVPTRVVAPHFPSRALQNRIDGQVKVEFALSADGRVQDARVLEAEPPQVFDAAALRAMGQWRFDPASIIGGAERRYTQHFDFSLDRAGAQGDARVEECQVLVGSRICQRNRVYE